MTSEALLKFLDDHGFDGYTFSVQDVFDVTKPASPIKEVLEIFTERLLSIDPADLSKISKAKVADLMSHSLETFEAQENRILTPAQSEQVLADLADIFAYIRTHAVIDYEALMDNETTTAQISGPTEYPHRKGASMPTT